MLTMILLEAVAVKKRLMILVEILIVVGVLYRILWTVATEDTAHIAVTVVLKGLF